MSVSSIILVNMVAIMTGTYAAATVKAATHTSEIVGN